MEFDSVAVYFLADELKAYNDSDLGHRLLYGTPLLDNFSEDGPKSRSVKQELLGQGFVNIFSLTDFELS